jgi:hypothetical protein
VEHNINPCRGEPCPLIDQSPCRSDHAPPVERRGFIFLPRRPIAESSHTSHALLCTWEHTILWNAEGFSSLSDLAGRPLSAVTSRHRLATSGSELGRVVQIINKEELVSEVDISTGVPSIPFAIKGTVVTRAALRKESPEVLRLALKVGV